MSTTYQTQGKYNVDTHVTFKEICTLSMISALLKCDQSNTLHVYLYIDHVVSKIYFPCFEPILKALRPLKIKNLIFVTAHLALFESLRSVFLLELLKT